MTSATSSRRRCQRAPAHPHAPAADHARRPEARRSPDRPRRDGPGQTRDHGDRGPRGRAPATALARLVAELGLDPHQRALVGRGDDDVDHREPVELDGPGEVEAPAQRRRSGRCGAGRATGRPDPAAQLEHLRAHEPVDGRGGRRRARGRPGAGAVTRRGERPGRPRRPAARARGRRGQHPRPAARRRPGGPRRGEAHLAGGLLDGGGVVGDVGSARSLDRLDLGRPMQDQRDLVAGEPRLASPSRSRRHCRSPTAFRHPGQQAAGCEAVGTAVTRSETPWSAVGSLAGMARRRSGGGDLFAAAAEEQLAQQAPLAARLRPMRLDDIVGQDELVGPGQAAAGAGRVGPAVVGHLLGAARHREDHARPGHRPPHRQGLRAALGGVGQRQGRARDRGQGRASGWGSGARARSCSSTRCTGSTRPSRTPCCPRSRAGCWCWWAPPPRTRTSRSTRRCCPARRCSASSPSTPRRSPRCCARGSTPRAPTADDEALAHLAERAGGDGRHALTSLEVAVALARARDPGVATPDRDRGRRRGRARHQAAPLRPRRALRRDLGVHQEHPGLRPPGRAALPGPHARGGRGRPLHRPPPRHPGQRGRGRGRPHRAGRGHRRRPRGRVRRTARGPAQPGAGRVHLATAPKSNRSAARHVAGPGGRAQGRRRRGARPPAGRPLPLGPLARARGGLRLSSRRPAGWVRQQYLPDEARGTRCTTSPPATATSRRSPTAWTEWPTAPTTSGDDHGGDAADLAAVSSPRAASWPSCCWPS